MNQHQQRRYISREFKKRGLSLQPAALSALLNVLKREREAKQQMTLKKKKTRQSSSDGSNSNTDADILHILLDEIKERIMSSSYNTPSSTTSSFIQNQSIVTKEILQDVVADLSRDENDVLDEAVQLLNAWKMKRLDYDSMKKRWRLLDEYDELDDKRTNGTRNTSSAGEGATGQSGDGKTMMMMKGRSVFGDPCDKINMLLQRYCLIQQRILRQDIFQTNLSSNIITSINQNNSPSSSKRTAQPVKITPIEGLLGTKGIKTLLGIIIQIEQNQYYLEDPSSSIRLDLSQVKHASTDGFITEYSIVLVEGEMSYSEGETFIVYTVGHPMYETRFDAISNIGLQNSNLFDTIPNLNELVKLQKEEVDHGDEGMFVLLSDVHLDDVNVLEKLDQLFQGFNDQYSTTKNGDDDYSDEDDDGDRGDDNYQGGGGEDEPPLPVFILMGDFASKYPTSNNFNGVGNVNRGDNGTGGGVGESMTLPSFNTNFITNLFDDLANIITKYPKIAQEGRFILIPSMNDVGLGSILPRPPLPQYFTNGLRSKVKNVHLASNPCRLRYFSKEIVLGRIDVLSKLRRNCIVSPGNNNMDILDLDMENEDSEEDDVDEMKNPYSRKRTKERHNDKVDNNMDVLIQHSIKTILDQGHLCPIPTQSMPIYWQYDHALRVYPPPDILVLGESTTKRYSEKYEDDVEVMNPGPFHVNYEFLVIKPCDVDDCGNSFVNVEFSQVV